MMPAAAAVALASQPHRSVAGTELAPTGATPDLKPMPRIVGLFIRSFNYSGPSSYIVHAETRAADGKNAYVDADSPFAALPADLAGADWVQAANRDSLYSAVDLMEVAVAAGSVVSIAHDDRLTRPAWLTRQFLQTATRIKLNRQTMTVFQRRIERDESLTLGANAERQAAPANMYVVFIQGK